MEDKTYLMESLSTADFWFVMQEIPEYSAKDVFWCWTDKTIEGDLNRTKQINK